MRGCHRSCMDTLSGRDGVGDRSNRTFRSIAHRAAGASFSEACHQRTHLPQECGLAIGVLLYLVGTVRILGFARFPRTVVDAVQQACGVSAGCGIGCSPRREIARNGIWVLARASLTHDDGRPSGPPASRGEQQSAPYRPRPMVNTILLKPDRDRTSPRNPTRPGANGGLAENDYHGCDHLSGVGSRQIRTGRHVPGPAWARDSAHDDAPQPPQAFVHRRSEAAHHQAFSSSTRSSLQSSKIDSKPWSIAGSDRANIRTRSGREFPDQIRGPLHLGSAW